MPVPLTETGLSKGAFAAVPMGTIPAAASLDRTPVDLGTLGGLSSRANALNADGHVVGAAQNGASETTAGSAGPQRAA